MSIKRVLITDDLGVKLAIVEPPRAVRSILVGEAVIQFTGTSDGNKGDITITDSGNTWKINDSAKGRKKLNFSYGDVTTQTIYQAIAGQRITKVEVAFDVAFNVASTLSIGDGADTQRLMDTGQNNPLIGGAWSSHPFHLYASNTNILLTLNVGSGANQGSGAVIVYYE